MSTCGSLDDQTFRESLKKLAVHFVNENIRRKRKKKRQVEASLLTHKTIRFYQKKKETQHVFVAKESFVKPPKSGSFLTSDMLDENKN